MSNRSTWLARQGRIAVVAVLLGMATLLAASPAAGQDKPTVQGPAALINEVGIDPNFGVTVPLDLEFVDSTGKHVRLGDLLGDRPVILHLVYYECPMLCKLSGDGLLTSVEELTFKAGDDFTIITLSFDPREGPDLSARARAMASERYGKEAVDRGWHFLTGTKESIDALLNSVGFRYAYDKDTGQYAHASGVFILTPEGVISRYLSGVDYLPRDLRLSIVEASAGEVGTTADQVLLMCYLYDPTTGKYGLEILTALRVAGIATVGVMGAAIFFMLRHDHSHEEQGAEAAETTSTAPRDEP